MRVIQSYRAPLDFTCACFKMVFLQMCSTYNVSITVFFAHLRQVAVISHNAEFNGFIKVLLGGSFLHSRFFDAILAHRVIENFACDSAFA